MFRENGAKCRTLHEVLSMVHVGGSEVFSASMLRMHCYVSVATSSIATSITLFATSRLRHKYKGKALLRCLANSGYANAPRGHVTCTGTVLLRFSTAHYILYMC